MILQDKLLSLHAHRISFRSKATKKQLDTDGAAASARTEPLDFIPCPTQVSKRATSLVFIDQKKIETKTIWSCTDPNLIPSFS
jgi:hypothetical protein